MTKKSSKKVVAINTEVGKIPLYHLYPLLSGKPVALSMEGSTIFFPSGATKNPVAVLMPSELLGQPSALIVSVTGFGCEVIDTNNVDLTLLLKAGLRHRAAVVLKSNLEALYMSVNEVD